MFRPLDLDVTSCCTLPNRKEKRLDSHVLSHRRVCPEDLRDATYAALLRPDGPALAFAAYGVGLSALYRAGSADLTAYPGAQVSGIFAGRNQMLSSQRAAATG